MITINHKRGATYQKTFMAREVDGSAVPLTGYQVSSQIRTPQGDLVADAAITITDEMYGQFDAFVEDTSAWPLGKLLQDVKYVSPEGEINYTETLEINVLENITV